MEKWEERLFRCIYQPRVDEGRAATIVGVSPSGLPVSIECRPDDTIARKECGPSYVICPSQPGEFWEFLQFWVVNEGQYLRWLVEALANGTAVLVTDGSFEKYER